MNSSNVMVPLLERSCILGAGAGGGDGVAGEQLQGQVRKQLRGVCH